MTWSGKGFVTSETSSLSSSSLYFLLHINAGYWGGEKYWYLFNWLLYDFFIVTTSLDNVT